MSIPNSEITPVAKPLSMQIGMRIQLQDVISWLADARYSRESAAHSYGQFSVVGGSLRIYAVNYVHPLIIDFFGDEVEHIYAIGTQKVAVTNVQLQPNIIDSDGSVFQPGQYVVHLDHGIAQFRTLGFREVGAFGDSKAPSPYAVESTEVRSEERYQPFLILDFADGAELFVPPDQTNKLTHYIGSRAPHLSKLGSKRWQATKKKVEEDLFKLAKDLLIVAAKRELHTRPIPQIQGSWLTQVSQGFPYDETDDQQKAIDDSLSDLGSPKPMDRLICGDVGFGKTEVALRAAVAVASAGSQVALLAPTTLLVEQHLATFQTRLSDLPVRVAALSRFTKAADEERTIRDIQQGTADIVIGTHRLLQADVDFKDLGLVIIDEEQKFGVKHKEYLKKLRSEVDVLTLSATPIPRTLFSGLSGLRDISLILSPPHNRLPIETVVAKSDNSLVKNAVKAELKREGQVFVLHNDVASIEARAKELRLLVPHARIAVAHGQMPEMRLATTMQQMIRGEIDVLVTSTIIESGLDMPRVNTLIVDKCDHFGLSDLYQIRGRIGRSATQGYAYFLHDTPALSQMAHQRLKVLVEADTLGSGYTIALRDLEIRGGGNVLGKQQHGNMEAIGLSLYSKLLQSTVQRLRASGDHGIVADTLAL